MATTIVKRFLSGSTDGLPLEIATTQTVCAIIHVGQTSTNVWEELYLYAMMEQTQTAAITMTVVINSSCFTMDIPVRSIDYPVLAGFPIWGRSASGTQIEVFASSTANLFVYGYVNRMTE
jgi:hypothetical protein